MHDKIIKEQRLAQAIKKKLLGPSGKLGTIVISLGHPIIREGGGFFESNYRTDIDYWYKDYEDPEELPVAEDIHKEIIGYIFDGLSLGKHIEIRYLDDNKQLTVYYKGFKVFEEIAGDLAAYNPFESWENMIEDLYKIAEKKYKKIIKEEEEIMQQKIEQEQKTLWQKMKILWGI